LSVTFGCCSLIKCACPLLPFGVSWLISEICKHVKHFAGSVPIWPNSFARPVQSCKTSYRGVHLHKGASYRGVHLHKGVSSALLLALSAVQACSAIMIQQQQHRLPVNAWLKGFCCDHSNIKTQKDHALGHIFCSKNVIKLAANLILHEFQMGF